MVTEIIMLVLGTILGCLASLVPGLHVYNIIGFAIILYFSSPTLTPISLIMFLIGMLVSYSFMFTISSIYFSVPDDSTIFVLLPGQRMLLEGRGYEAVVYVGRGCLIGLMFLVLIIPLLQSLLPIIWNVFSSYIHFVIGAVILYMLMSEFPKGGEGGDKRLRRAWKNILAGYVTFGLSALLGIILFNHTLVPIDMAFQNLMPALIGLFAIPTLLINIISKFKVPEQKIITVSSANKREIVHGSLGGILGGLFAALIPSVTAGVGGYLASHATAQRGDKAFLISQGVSRTIYYVGAVLLFFIPTLHLKRGALSSVVNLFYTPRGPQDFYLILGGIALSGFISFVLLMIFAKEIGKRVHKIDQRYVSIGVILFLTFLVGILLGVVGILVMYVAAMIGIIPILYNSRRSHCLAVILVPIFLSMSGIYVPL